MENSNHNNKEIKNIPFCPRIVRVESGRYGVLRIRPLGAGEGLEMARIHREKGDLFTEADELKEEKNLKTKNEKLQKVLSEIQKLSEMELELYRKCVEGENDELVKRFFDENDLPAITSFLGEALNG